MSQLDDKLSFEHNRYSFHKCIQITSLNIILIIAELFLFRLSAQTIILALFLNYCLALTIIVNQVRDINSSYNAISQPVKIYESDISHHEFLKLAGNFCLIIMAILITEKYFSLSSIWAAPIMYGISILIALRWNSREFLKRFFDIICGILSFKSTKRVSFEEILVADAWTSFARPLSQLVGANHLTLKFIVFA